MAAYVGAVMEAVERQVTSSPPIATFRAPIRTVLAGLDLHALGLLEGARDLDVDCAWGTDLLTGHVLPVPMANVQCPWYGDRIYDVTSTNGLASGNNRCT